MANERWSINESRPVSDDEISEEKSEREMENAIKESE